MEKMKMMSHEEDEAAVEEELPALKLNASLYGLDYNLKWLGLFALRCKSLNYSFKLATVAVEPHKHDALVLEYRAPDEDESHILFLQTRNTSDGQDFYLKEYYSTYSKVRRNKLFSKAKTFQFLGCTNTSFENNAVWVEQTIRDDPKLMGDGVQWYQVNESERKQLEETLKATTELHQLANELVDFCIKMEKGDEERKILEEKVKIITELLQLLDDTPVRQLIERTKKGLNIDFNNDLFKKYSRPLRKYIDGNQRSDVRFHQLFLDKLKQRMPEFGENRQALIKERLNSSFSPSFNRELNENSLKKLANKVAKLLKMMEDAKTAKIPTPEEKKIQLEMKYEFRKLMGSIFQMDSDGMIRFVKNVDRDYQTFLQELKKSLEKLGNQINIENVSFTRADFANAVSTSKTIKQWTEQDLDLILQPEEFFPTEDVESFLKEFVFVVNLPNEDQLDQSIQQEIKKIINDKTNVDSFMKKMYGWMMESQTTNEYFTEKDLDRIIHKDETEIMEVE